MKLIGPTDGFTNSSPHELFIVGEKEWIPLPNKAHPEYLAFWILVSLLPLPRYRIWPLLSPPRLLLKSTPAWAAAVSSSFDLHPPGVYSPRSSLCGPSETEVRARHSLAWSFRHQLTLNSDFFLLETGSLFPLWFQSVTFLLAHATLFTFASLPFLENTKHMSASWPLYLLSPSA